MKPFVRLPVPTEGVYGFPVSSLAFLGFYNKEIFEKYDLEVPMNWEDYLDVCEVLKNNSVVPQIQGAKDLWQTRHVLDPCTGCSVKGSEFCCTNGGWRCRFYRSRDHGRVEPGMHPRLLNISSLNLNTGFFPFP